MQRKKLLLSIVLIGVMAFAVSAGTYAWFFDNETSAGNVFQTGTIDIEVEDVTPTLNGDPKIVTEDGGNNLLKPSQVGYLTKKVTNVGNNPAKIFKRIQTRGTGENVPQPESEELDFHQTPSGFYNFADYIDFDLTVVIEWDPNVKLLIPYTVGGSNTSLSSVIGKWILLGALQPDEGMLVEQSFHLRNTDGDTNWAQDDQLLFDEDFQARQTTGPGGQDGNDPDGEIFPLP